MKTSYQIILLVLVVAGSFLTGSLVTHYAGNHKSGTERKILYYVDPMNPAFRSAKPGIAPCGMALEPVYADGKPAGGAAKPASLPPGTIHIYPEKQQLIGIKTALVEKTPWNRTLRVLGRVTADETRVYRVNAAVSGLIKNALPVTTGSLVKENELLATFYSSQEYRALVQNYFNALKLIKSGSWNTGTTTGAAPVFSKSQLAQMKKTSRDLGQTGETYQIDYYRRNILNSGIGLYQLKEMERTGAIPEEIEIRSPAAGFVIQRNVTADYRFDKGTELFRIADISRVWILADVFENEASFFKPGLAVKIELPYQKKTLYARMSNVLPQFDPATRTLKIRLEADNSGYRLRPDMFVNVEIPVSGPAAIIVPADAVLDSGLKKTVFVDRGNGYFEPRQVETGQQLGERVEITQGLMNGEKIVVAGNFLIDSESRMQQAASGIFGKIGRDPVCGMNIDEDRAGAEGHLAGYRGQSYYFCSPECRDEFVKMPDKYTSTAKTPANMLSSGENKNAAIDHTMHGASKMESSHSGKKGPHDHGNGKKSMSPGHDAFDMESLSGEKMKPSFPEGMNSPMPSVSLSSEAASPLQKEKISGIPAPMSGNQQWGGAGPGVKVLPGAQGTTSVMPPAPKGPLPEAFKVRLNKAPEKEGGSVMPGVPSSAPGKETGSSMPIPANGKSPMMQSTDNGRSND